MANALLREYDAFKRATDALEIAASALREVGDVRPDQRRAWYKVAETLRVTREAVFRLAGAGTVGKHNG